MQAIAERVAAIMVGLQANTIGGTAWVVVGSGVGGAPPFTNGWAVAFGHTVRFRQDAAGNVHLRGVVNGGASGTSVFTLPVGMRPNQQTNIAVMANGSTGTATLAVMPTGLVVITFGGTGANLAGLDSVFSPLP
jgi:hypothetical protein